MSANLNENQADQNDPARRPATQLTEGGEDEAKSELYDDINSLYDMENPRGGEDNHDIKSQLS